MLTKGKIVFMAQETESIILNRELMVKRYGDVLFAKAKNQTKRGRKMSIEGGYAAFCDGVQIPKRAHKPCPKKMHTEIFPTRWEARQEAVRMGFRFLKRNYDIGDIFACPYCTQEYSSLGLLGDKLATR